jgi:NADH:ubiquinone oxidoreductase subunit E
MEAIDLSRADAVLQPYRGDRSALLKALQAVQAEYNYLPREALARVADWLGVPLSETLRVATFYKAFSLEPRKKFCVNVCLGTACHVRGSARLHAKLQSELAMGAGDLFSLEPVRCVGCCSMAPVLRIGNDTYGRVRLDKVSGLLRRYREEGKE